MEDSQCEVAAKEWLRLSEENEKIRNQYISQQASYDESLKRWQSTTGEFEKYKNKDSNEPFWYKDCWGNPHGSFDWYCAQEAAEKKLHKASDYIQGSRTQCCSHFGAICTHEKAECVRKQESIERENEEWNRAKPLLPSKKPEAVLPDINCCYNAINLVNTDASDLNQTCSNVVSKITQKGDAIGTTPIVPSPEAAPKAAAPEAATPEAATPTSRKNIMIYVAIGILTLILIIGIVAITLIN